MSKEKTLILGLGNPLRGDDGVGPAVVVWLQERGLPPGVVAMDGGTSGLELVLTMMDHDRVLIVDAADMHRTPGAWASFRPDLARIDESEPFLSMHDAGLPEALALGASLRVLPKEVIVFGVQPAQVAWAPGLSAEVQAAVPVVAHEVLRCAENDVSLSGHGETLGLPELAALGFVHDHDHM